MTRDPAGWSYAAIPSRLWPLLKLAEPLTNDELAVLVHVAEGLRNGHEVYGPLNIRTDKRNFRKETLEEVRDGLVYAAIALIQLQRGDS